MKRVALWALLGVLAILVGSIPRLHRCHRYGKLLATSTALDRLEIIPVKIDLPPPSAGSRLSLGYASVIIPEPIERIRVSRSVVTIDCEKAKFMFWGPHNLEREWPPNQETNPVQRALAHEYMTQPFQHLRKVLNVAPVGYSHVFLMGAAAFEEHALLSAAKVLHVQGRSIGEFSNADVQGFLHVSLFEDKNKCHAVVFSRRGGISQGVFADANSPDASKERILPLLSSLTYTLKRVPSEEELHEVIVSVLRAHPKYVPDPEG